ncbi:hypothetical protein ACGFNU_20890 [Spirillospora sp. NPDC048911]|uniref:hypothetical protein n=1 Tax=Spirillospora sp. NPDC048911 TaxID=3364527 RepID=UPI0037233C33
MSTTNDRRTTRGLTLEQICDWAAQDPKGFCAAVDQTAADLVAAMVQDIRRGRRRRFWSRLARWVRGGFS